VGVGYTVCGEEVKKVAVGMLEVRELPCAERGDVDMVRLALGHDPVIDYKQKQISPRMGSVMTMILAANAISSAFPITSVIRPQGDVMS